MNSATWNDSLRIGISALDDEHRTCCRLLDDLQVEVRKGGENGQAGVILHALADQIRVHFGSEEAMMSGDKYPGLALHVMKHDYLTQQLRALAARVERTPGSLNEHALGFLREWFYTHILKDDKAFGLWLMEHGKY